MQTEILPTAADVAKRAAAVVAASARAAVQARGKFTFAVSGGTTPWQMLKALATEDVPWAHVHLFQVDERVAPTGSDARNLTHLQASLFPAAPLPPAQLYAMPVNDADLDAAAQSYAETLARVCGSPAELDLVHLGMGPDGHCGSLVPGDSVLAECATDVAMTGGLYQGTRRMTLTYPILNRARHVLWLVTGSNKQEMLLRLHDGDTAIPAGQIERDRALILGDLDAAALLS